MIARQHGKNSNSHHGCLQTVSIRDRGIFNSGKGNLSSNPKCECHTDLYSDGIEIFVVEEAIKTTGHDWSSAYRLLPLRKFLQYQNVDLRDIHTF